MESIANQDVLQLLKDGISQFNYGDFFDSHETLESAWRMETSPNREIIQALIQFSVGCHHLKRKNWIGAEKVLIKAKSKLLDFEGVICFVNCEDIIIQVDKILDVIRRNKDLPIDAIELPEFPKLTLIG